MLNAVNHVSTGYTVRGFSAVVQAGRWVFYIPGCFSARAATVDGFCTTLVRFDSLCSQANPFTHADCYAVVNVKNVLDFAFSNKFNFGSAVFDGSRYLYVVSGTGDEM